MSSTSCPVDPAERTPVPGAATRQECPVGPPEAGRFIPYVTPLKGETPASLKDLIVLPDELGIGRVDETPDDRDVHGALWIRASQPAPGRPIPLFRQVHARRSRDVMLDMRCQGCNGDPSRTAAGTLFFMQPDERRVSRFWPETEYTLHPPICLPCTHQAMLRCPFVQSAPALRVRNPQPWGVYGIGFRPHRLLGGLREDRGVDRCAYSDLKNLPWMLALQPVARLRRCTVVDVRAELAAEGLELPVAGQPNGVA